MTKEVELRLRDMRFVFRPTFAAMGHIEQQCGIGLITLAQKFLHGTISLRELATIVRECMMESGISMDIEPAIVEGGLAQTMQAVGDLFALVFGNDNSVGQIGITLEELRDLQRRFPDIRDLSDSVGQGR